MTSFCLNMIVKNEAHIIEETLASIVPYIDDYIINDTGSTDNTIEVITNFFNKRHVTGQIFINEFNNFEYARTIAFQLAMKHSKSKYIWVIDADDLVKGNPKFPKTMFHDCYQLQYGSEFSYGRSQIFKNDLELNWRYEGWVHEYPMTDKTDATYGKIDGLYIESRRLGDRSKNPNKYLDDAEKLNECYDIYRRPRDLFYSGNSYFDHVSVEDDFKDDPNYNNNKMEHLINAANKYRARINLNLKTDFKEEVFYSYLRLGETLERMKIEWTAIEKNYLKGIEYMPERSPELYDKLITHYKNKDKLKAFNYAKIAIKYKYPSECLLFLHKSTYDYKILFDFCELAIDLKYGPESYTSAKIIENKSVDYPHIKTPIQNILKKIIITSNNVVKESCLLYVGNSNNPVFSYILEFLNTKYKIYLVGNINIEHITVSAELVTMEYLQKNKKECGIKKIYLFNALNLLLDLKNFGGVPIILIQTEGFSFVFEHNFKVNITNQEYLEKLLDNITIIISNTELPIINKTDILDLKNMFDLLKITDKISKIKYNVNKDYFNKYNGFKLNVINITLLKNILQKCNIPELYLYLIYYAFENKNYTEVDNILNYSNKLIKNKQLVNILNMMRAKYLYEIGKYEESYSIAITSYKLLHIDDTMDWFYEDIKDLNIPHIQNKYLNYPNKIKNIIKKPITDQTRIILTITTCKRYDLFNKTMNSFINCCTDLEMIDSFVCIDDNSTQEDRDLMKLNYPFFNYIFKDETNKGHIKSMNIIYTIIANNTNI